MSGAKYVSSCRICGEKRNPINLNDNEVLNHLLTYHLDLVISFATGLWEDREEENESE